MLLEIGNGQIQGTPKGDIKIPYNFANFVSIDEELVDEVHPDNYNISKKPDSLLCERAILSPNNEASGNINNYLLDKLYGDKKTYCAFDSVAVHEEAVNHPTEVLNSLEFSQGISTPPGIFLHKLFLTKGTQIILL